MKLRIKNLWVMYHEVNKLKRMGFSNAQISRYLEMDPRTVSKYAGMDENEFETQLDSSSPRVMLLDAYEDFVKNKLGKYPDTSAAQMFDWLKERYGEQLPKVSSRTVYNFVMHVRHKFEIPIEKKYRDFQAVEELPYGQQAQVDFGVYNMRTSKDTRKKVYFFAMVLSRSRMKYVWFLEQAFTSLSVIDAHEKAFMFYGGVPKELVYDQDRTMLVDENLGDLILTAGFKQYCQNRPFKVHFCRKSDPQSKGKIEIVIQYVKKNFLYNRIFNDLETLNEQAQEWLSRTANKLEHNATKKSPYFEYLIEREQLLPYFPIASSVSELKPYYVRKNNLITYRSNFYRLPSKTYQGLDTQVWVREQDNQLHIYDIQNQLLCTHPISNDQGQIIGKPNRQRNTSLKITDQVTKITESFTTKEAATSFLDQIKDKYPRYFRDHLLQIDKTLNEISNQLIKDKTLDFCIKNELFSGNEFRDAFFCLLDNLENKTEIPSLILLDKENQDKINIAPQQSDIDLYEAIMNPNQKG
jgi:transposase